MGDDTEVKLPLFGKSISIKGLGTVIVCLTMGLAAGLGWMLYDLSHAAATAVKEAVAVQQQTVQEHKAIMEAAERITADHIALDESVKRVDSSVKTQNYILLEDQAGKDKIKRRMAMPKELRDLLNDR